MKLQSKLRRCVSILWIGLFFNNLTTASTHCFIALEGDQVIQVEGNCKSRYAPCSTFKIAISLMGYNDGLLIDETHPEWPYKEGYADFLDRWKQPHNPRLWLTNSCVWYSQVLTQKLGMEKFKAYVKKFDYGNLDVSGDRGKNNGLTRSWLSGSLEISPEEQVRFLQKLVNNKLLVSTRSQEMTKKILFLEELAGGWKLYGKTGNGSLLTANKTQKLPQQIGWFVGWIQKGNRTISFAHLIVDDKAEETFASLRSKAAAKEKLTHLSS